MSTSSNLRSRLSLQTLAPNEVSTNPLSERSVVSEITTNSPSLLTGANSVSQSLPHDAGEYNENCTERDGTGKDRW